MADDNIKEAGLYDKYRGVGGGLDNNFTGELTSVEVPNTPPTSTGQTQLDQDIIAGTSSLGDIDAKALAFANNLPPPTTPTLDSMAGASNINLQDIGTGAVAPPLDDSGTLSSSEQVKADIIERQKILESVKTDEQKQAEGFSSELVKELGLLEDKTAFEAEIRAEKTNDLNEQLTSISSQIDALNAEKEVFRINQQGRPISLSYLTGSVAQNNAKLNSEILTLTAQGNAVLGKLALAEKQIEAAVNAEFRPREHKIEILTAQLAALEGTLTKDEQVQADALSEFYAAEKTKIAEEKAATIATKTGIAGALKTAIDKGIKDTATLEQIRNAKTTEEALQIVAENVPLATGKLLSPTEAAALNVPFGTTEAQAAALGIIPKAVLTGQDKVDVELKLGKTVDALSKEAIAAKRQIGLMKSSFEAAQEAMANGESINAASQGVLVTFQKILDPTSVVRESEYARSGQGLALIARMEGFATKLAQGGAGLTADDLEEFVTVGERFLENYNDSQVDTLKRARIQAENYGLNLDNILTPGARQLLDSTDKKEVSQWLTENSEQEENVLKLLEDNPQISNYDLLKVLIGGNDSQSFNNESQTSLKGLTSLNIGDRNIQVDKSIESKLALADRDFFNETGQHIQINQSFRTREQQQELFNRLSVAGGRVAPPGSSFHEKGLAVDVTNWQEAERFLRKYGLLNELSDDKGHFSFGEFTV